MLSGVNIDSIQPTGRKEVIQMFGFNVAHKRTLMVLAVMLIAALLLAGISVQTALAQIPSLGRFKVLEVFLPPDSPDASPQSAPLEYFSNRCRLEIFSPPVAPPQPDTFCWDYRYAGLCDCETHQYWEYWCHRCCNHPDNCPTGCCDIFCWWVEAGTCSCK